MSTQMEAIGETIDKLIQFERVDWDHGIESVTLDSGEVITASAAWWSYGTLTAIQQLLSQGVELPSKTVEKYLTEAHELMNGEE